jgi:hypothetical protein
MPSTACPHLPMLCAAACTRQPIAVLRCACIVLCARCAYHRRASSSWTHALCHRAGWPPYSWCVRLVLCDILSMRWTGSHVVLVAPTPPGSSHRSSRSSATDVPTTNPTTKSTSAHPMQHAGGCYPLVLLIAPMSVHSAECSRRRPDLL